MTRKAWIILLLALSCPVLAAGSQHARRVALVGDSLFGCAQDAIVTAINGNNGNSRVSAQYVQGGTTAYTNPINQVIQSKGPAHAFANADVVVFSFATNDMLTVAQGKISLPSAIRSMQTLIDQAVESGANCIVMLESSHRFGAPLPQSEGFETQMDKWFEHWHQKSGANEYQGKPYMFFLADISGKIEADMNNYLVDLIHFNKAGADLAARAIVERINMCPAVHRAPEADDGEAGADCTPDIGSEKGTTP